MNYSQENMLTFTKKRIEIRKNSIIFSKLNCLHHACQCINRSESKKMQVHQECQGVNKKCNWKKMRKPTA